MHPIGFGTNGPLLAHQFGKGVGRGCDFVGKLLGFCGTKSQRFGFGRRNQHAGKAGRILIADRLHDFGRDFFGRNHFPGIDPSVLRFIEPPARAGGVQPPRLVRLAVVVRIDIAVHLDAVSEIAPAIDHVIAVGIDEFSQNLPVRIAHHPARLTVDFFRLDRAFHGVGGGRNLVIDVLLNRRQLQRLLHARGGGLGQRRKNADRSSNSQYVQSAKRV